MKLNLRSLKYKIWLYFILFSLGIMCVVWIAQVVLTERYFVGKMESSLIRQGTDIEALYNDRKESEDSLALFTEYVKSAEIKDKIAVVISPRSYTGTAAESVPDSCYPLGKEMQSYYGEYGNVIAQAKFFALQNKKYHIGSITSDENKAGDTYVYAKVISEREENEEEGDPLFLILISPMDNVTDMLSFVQTELGIISIVVVVLAFAIALIIASSLSSPLTNMTSTAKKLAGGDFNVEFDANGYAEIAELSDTLNHMKEELKKTGVLQRELLANVTHDLKTPLTMVKAYAEMIKDISGDVKEKRDKHAQVIIDEADRLTMLVNDILNLSKVQSDMDALSLGKVDLSALTLKVIDRFSSFSESNGYTIKSEIAPGVCAEVDAQKIEQVIYNLIGNAINYTGEDKTVSVYLSREGDKATLEVVDTGKGIAEDQMETIWEKYYRASDTHKRPVKGTGLGLSIVKAILDAHGLKYGVISKKNEGSNFFVQFRAEDKEGE